MSGKNGNETKQKLKKREPSLCRSTQEHHLPHDCSIKNSSNQYLLQRECAIKCQILSSVHIKNKKKRVWFSQAIKGVVMQVNICFNARTHTVTVVSHFRIY